MKKRKIVASLLMVIAVSTIISPTIVSANDEEIVEDSIIEEVQVTEEPTTVVEENNIDTEETMEVVTRTPRAITDPAFTSDSQPLHNAIITKYPDIDALPNGNGDGIISQAEAASWSGTTIDLTGMGIGGRMDGIQYFTNPTLKELCFHNNNLIG
ncbi:MAG: hypothetical protein ACK5LC_07830 [Coprobacillaceae bacterium]